MVESTLKTYPEADGCWIWLAEGGCPATGDAESQKVLRQYEIRGKRPHSDSDLTLIHYGKELVGRIRRRHPDARLGLALLFRSRLFRMLDTLVPKDVPFASMESRPYSLPQMDDFGGLGRRETFLVPRLDEDINALAMRFAVSLYDNDGVLTGSARHCVGGVAPQTGKLRGLEQNARYLAEGAWNPQLTADQFYQGYLGRIFGAGALDEMLKACNLLEENDRAMNWDGLLNFCNYGGSPPIVLLRERCEDPFKRARPPQAWHGDLEHHNRWRQGFAAAIVRLREAASHLEHARPKTLGGSQHELEFLIFKTESYALHLETIRALLDGAISYDKLVQARLQGDKKEVRGQFDVCRTSFAKARDLARQAADLISAKAEDPDEKCILFRHHVFYVSPIEEFCRGMERWSAPPL
jgi:hypothetical protein